MDDKQRFLIRGLSTSSKMFWCIHLPQMTPAEHELLKQEVLVHLGICVQGRGQTMAIARMAQPHGGLQSVFRVESCADWLRREAGVSAQQARDAIANVESYGVHVAHKLNAIAANPRWMLGYVAASFQKPNVLVYRTDGMDPSGVKAAHQYMEAVAESCCAVHLSPTVTGARCPATAKCVEL